ncbi:MAG TPA: DUF6079 family protein [Symbiobacteriaceae bacterium]|nr:DUF6079 family protein [Symbiobacteriaceae bacterium]
MRYAELVQFEPIESVVQLTTSDNKAEATRLVSSFVISQAMADNLTKVVFPQLQFQTPKDNMGLLIVGNYGTGKSHLMSVVAAIAEDADQVDNLTNQRVVDPADQIAGQFVVIRDEIGASTDSLRNIICKMLEKGLARHGIEFQFPPQDQIIKNKDALEAMMAAFHEVFPDKGLLLVVDELLDYLGTRTKEYDLRLDLGFLREVGEVCKHTRFRFMAGVQEQLFNNPAFEFVSSQMRRVQERFHQVLISREDVSFVVTQRLLKKTPAQKAQIREYLTGFAHFFGSMTERMDHYVELFPVHPTYLETFERVHVAEKREILRTISTEMAALLQQEVPTDVPGLIAFDSYWGRIKSHPSYQTVPDIRTVMEKANVLEDKIRHGITKRLYVQPALRIIRGLAVHRLTTGDLRVALGLTAQELRDDLCILIPGADDADFLQTLLEKVLQEILTVVNGQFITRNKANGQYYLDVDRDVDYDALIQKKAASLDDDRLDRYYFDALIQVMELIDTPSYRTGFKIWEHEVEWRTRRVNRVGYLFLGAPNERPNTVPFRDFYLYFLEPFAPTKFKDEKKPDEIFFDLAHVDDTFTAALRTYAGAKELASSATGDSQKLYNKKAGDARKEIVDWLRGHMGTAFEVTYQGKKQRLVERAKGHVGNFVDIRAMINAVATVTFEDHFSNLAPEYPSFAVDQPVGQHNRNVACTDALKWIAGSVKGKLGGAVLDGLRLVDNGQIRTTGSPYAQALLQQLKAKGPGQVVNRSEILVEENQLELWQPFKLEPEFLAVVLGALVYTGEVVVALPQGQKKLDTGELDELQRIQAKDLASFKHIERPKDVPVSELRALFELLGLPPGLIVSEATREQGVLELQARVQNLAVDLAKAQSQVASGLTFWNQQLLSETEQNEWKKGLKALKEFVDGLQAYNTTGKLKNFRHDLDAISAQAQNLSILKAYHDLRGLLEKAQELVTYLSQAEGTLPSTHSWRDQVKAARAKLQQELLDSSVRSRPNFEQSLLGQLRVVKDAYVAAYRDLHQKARLSQTQDVKRQAFLKEGRYTQLQTLSAITLFPQADFQAVQSDLAGIKACVQLSGHELEKTTVCPQCQYRPVDEPVLKQFGAVLDGMDERLDNLLDKVTKSLLENLSDPTVKGNIALLTDPEGKATLEAFLGSGQLPGEVDASFVKAANEVLSGLDPVVITKGSLEQALFGGAGPLTPDDLKKRFEKVYTDLVKGKTLSQVRFVWE